ncbi:MAG: hypothetical protein V7K54_03160 [Nostoc sp.]
MQRFTLYLYLSVVNYFFYTLPMRERHSGGTFLWKSWEEFV